MGVVLTWRPVGLYVSPSNDHLVLEDLGSQCIHYVLCIAKCPYTVGNVISPNSFTVYEVAWNRTIGIIIMAIYGSKLPLVVCVRCLRYHCLIAFYLSDTTELCLESLS